MIPHEEGASGAGSSTEDEIMSASLEQGALGPESFDHEFKSHPDVFWPAARGEKTFEYRRDDRGGYEVGQTVRLRCYDPDHGYHGNPPLDRRITNILRGGEFELPQGYCILSLAPLSASAPASGAERMTAGEDAIDPHKTGLYLGQTGSFARVATPAPATPPGVPLADGSQVVAHLGPHFHAQPRAGGDANWASWSRLHDIYTTDPALCGRGRILVGTLSQEAVLAWQSASPGVPDSVRALSEAYRGCEAICAQMDADLPDSAEVYVVGARRSRYSLCTYGDIRRAVDGASRPAGQSAGSGAEEPKAHSLKLSGRPSDDMLTGVTGWLKQMRNGADNLGDQLKASAALYAVTALLAPDSTRTGQVGVPDIVRSAIAHAAAADGFANGPAAKHYAAMRALEWVETLLAARPADPEAQGAWRPISTAPKDGSLVDLWTYWPEHDRWRREAGCGWVDGDWHNGTWSFGQYEYPPTVTHWMPLPAPPPSSGQGGR